METIQSGIDKLQSYQFSPQRKARQGRSQWVKGWGAIGLSPPKKES